MGYDPFNTWTAIALWQSVTKALIKQDFCMLQLRGGSKGLTLSVRLSCSFSWRGWRLLTLPGEGNTAQICGAVQ